ncbi:unnamed protein product [Meganyctiphanes norvegica]|uniref:Envelope fusion protein n=1 Tax=Meganyctiphanes norvegica TaxID=48144 RepID=A0AAV2Q8B0_MEGNR
MPRLMLRPTGVLLVVVTLQLCSQLLHRPVAAQKWTYSNITKFNRQNYESNAFHKGNLFLPRGTVIIANSQIIVPIHFYHQSLVNHYATLVKGIEEILTELKPFNSTDFGLFKEDIEAMGLEIKSKVGYIFDFFYGLKSKYRNIRVKRGAVNIIGDIGNVLFGLATQDQINDINEALNTVESQSEESLKQLNILNSAVELSAIRLDKMKIAQLKSLNTLSTLLTHTQQLSKQVMDLSKRSMLEHVFAKLGLHMLELFINSDNLVEGIKTVFSGKFDERIIENKILLNILKTIERKGHKLILPADSLSLAAYKELIKLTAIYSPERDKITLFLSIPTYAQNPLPEFSLYEVIPFPTPVSNGHGTVLNIQDLPKYIVASEQYYLELQSLENCLQAQNMFFCHLRTNLFSMSFNQNCAAHIFKRDENYLHFCKHTYSKGAKDQFLKINNEFYYYTNKSLPVEILCLNSSYNTHLTLQGQGYFKMAPQCQGMAPGILLPASMASFSKFSANISYHVPTEFRVNLLNTSYLPVLDGKTLANITNSLGGEASLQDIVHMMITTKERSQFLPHRHDLFHIGLLLVILVIGVCIYRWYMTNRGHEELPEHQYEEPRTPAMRMVCNLRGSTGSIAHASLLPGQRHPSISNPVSHGIVANHTYTMKYKPAREPDYLSMEELPTE